MGPNIGREESRQNFHNQGGETKEKVGVVDRRGGRCTDRIKAEKEVKRIASRGRVDRN